MPTPALPTVEIIQERLKQIFPEGIASRKDVVGMSAARTVFVLLYIGAIEGNDRWLAPKHVYRMTSEQAERQDRDQRHAYAINCMKPKFHSAGKRWYLDNTRESVRDDTLKKGFIPLGVVIVLEGIPTTSNKGRYALKREFSALFSPELGGGVLGKEIADWQESNLSSSALLRVRILMHGAVASKQGVMVTFPNGETRRMAAGRSSIISKAVVEEFSRRFLDNPGVIFLSESSNKVVERDDALAKDVGLNIVAERLLPDMILVDLGSGDPLLVFVEVVATDGAITEDRKAALLEITAEGGFAAERVAFVTAFMDRDSAAFKKSLPNLAWGSFAWCVAEPDQILILRDNATAGRARLFDLVVSN